MIFDLMTIINICIALLACAVVWLAAAQIKINPQNKRVMIVFICLALGMGGLTALVDIKRTAYEEKLLKQMLESQNEILGLRNKVKELEGENKEMAKILEPILKLKPDIFSPEIKAALNESDVKDQNLTPLEEHYAEVEKFEKLDNTLITINTIQSPRIVSTIFLRDSDENHFIMEEYYKKKLDDGGFEIRFTLAPQGKSNIPLFQIGCQTQKNAKILIFDIKGEDFSESWSMNSKNSQSKFRTKDNTGIHYRRESEMEPQNIEVLVKTDKDPGNPRFSIYPMKYIFK
ncbi:MAG: hypothetical protein IID03_11670 [Candidatus Dadabacteria bacterium]|nr:hypothetical protein [Candidatus Dadabacteria bacterium]